MFMNQLLCDKEIEVINNSSYDLDIEVVGVPVAKDMTKREQNLSILGVVKQQTTMSGIQQQARTISKRHVIKKNVRRGFLTESFDVVSVKLFFVDGNAPVREEEMTCHWVWTISDDSLPALSHSVPDESLPHGVLVPGRPKFVDCFVSGCIGALLMGYVSYYWHNYGKST